jgi:hypothetical protein
MNACAWRVVAFYSGGLGIGYFASNWSGIGRSIAEAIIALPAPVEAMAVLLLLAVFAIGVRWSWRRAVCDYKTCVAAHEQETHR